MNSTVLVNKERSNYYYYFNKGNGLSIRSEYKGFKDPFWSVEGPELLDVSITSYCEKECTFCYRDSSVDGHHMSLHDFEMVMNYMRDTNTYQIALGGGNPNQHPQFIELLKMCREKYGIVPSYTTNGDGLTLDILKASKKYCGAVAISYYEPLSKFKAALKEIISHNIKTNIHFLLTPKTVEIAIDWLHTLPEFLDGINAIVFLNYKPVGSNASNALLLKNSNRIREFFALIGKHDINRFKIGFDSCTVSGIVEYLDVPPSFIESCEAGRFSAFISEDMKLYPCSFMEKTLEGIDLRNITLKDAWFDSTDFLNMRDKMAHNTCNGRCEYEEHCSGGCPVFHEINVCSNFKICHLLKEAGK